MIMTPIRPADAPERPKIDALEDAAADLDISETLSRAAQHQLHNVREYLGMLKTPVDGALRQYLNDLETLVCEASYKAIEAKRTILAFHEGEFAARRSDIG